jgi:DNA-binding NarL/FixJ family response regulator
VVHVLQDAGLDVVAAVGDARDLVRKARAHSPDVAVVDIRMPPNSTDDGLRAAQEIRTMDPTIAVLVVSQFLEEGYAIELLGDRSDGVGYLLKDHVVDAEGFVDAVRQVARGGSVIDAEVVDLLITRRRRHDPVAKLTGREREVLALMAEGKSNQGIAEALFVTVSAVERHVTNIFARLGLPHEGQNHRRVLAVLRHLHR